MSRRASTDKVNCPTCGHGISKVVDTRGPDRLRECIECGTRYTTIETVARVVPKGWGRLPSQKAQSSARVVREAEETAIDRG